MMVKNGKVMRKAGMDGWARLCASVLQHAFIRVSRLYEKQRKGHIKKEELQSIRIEIKKIREFLTDDKNEFIAYLEAKGHAFDTGKIIAIIESYERGEKCPTTMGRAKVHHS